MLSSCNYNNNYYNGHEYWWTSSYVLIKHDVTCHRASLHQWWRDHAKSWGLKYSAPNINVYVLMIFTAFSLKSGEALAPLPSLFHLLCTSSQFVPCRDPPNHCRYAYSYKAKTSWWSINLFTTPEEQPCVSNFITKGVCDMKAFRNSTRRIHTINHFPLMCC